MAVELGSQGVTVNCICPGPIRTGMTAAIPERAKEQYVPIEYSREPTCTFECHRILQFAPVFGSIDDMWVGRSSYAKRLSPLRRYAEAEEVAQITASVCLPASSYLNGCIINVDGGLVANNALLPFRLPWTDADGNP
jgi:3-oxoacyl-[acyl-carrier protein] reductase